MEKRVKEGWLSGWGWNPPRGKLVLRKKRHFITRPPRARVAPRVWKKSLAGVRMCYARCSCYGYSGRCGLARSVDSVVVGQWGGTHVPVVACSETSP